MVDLVPAGALRLAGESQPGAGAASRGTGPRTRAASGGADGPGNGGADGAPDSLLRWFMSSLYQPI